MLGNELSKSLNKTKIQIQSKERELDMDWSRFSEDHRKDLICLSLFSKARIL